MKNGDKHCSYCIYYVAFANCQMYCKALLRNEKILKKQQPVMQKKFGNP